MIHVFSGTALLGFGQPDPVMDFCGVDNTGQVEFSSCYQKVHNVHTIPVLPLRNRKHVPCFYRVIQAQVKVWENEKCWEHEPHTSVSTAFASSPKLSRVVV